MRKQNEREGTLNRKMLLPHQGERASHRRNIVVADCSNLPFWVILCFLAWLLESESEYNCRTNWSCLRPGVIYHLPFLSFLPPLSTSACIHSVPPLNPGLLLSIRSDRPCVLLADWQILGECPLFLLQIPLHTTLTIQFCVFFNRCRTVFCNRCITVFCFRCITIFCNT